MGNADSNSENNSSVKQKIGCKILECADGKCSLVAFALIVLFSIVGVYHKTLLSGIPISKLDLIKNLDILYNPDLKGVTVSVPQDPSACTQSVPKETFIQSSLHKMQSPIWNPNSGCGQPIIADPSNTLWDPVDLLFSARDQRIYNRGLLLKIVLGGLAAYFYFFRSGAAPWAACTAAIGYALSARILYHTELPENIMSGIFLVFSFLHKDSSLKRILLCALGLSFCYVGIHPELFFVGTCSAVGVWFLSDTANNPNQAKELDVKSDQLKNRNQKNNTASLSGSGVKFPRAVMTMALAGLATIALVGPFLFSFIEYMCYAQTYKYAAFSLEFIPFSQLAFYFYSAKIPDTYFPGLVLLLGLPAGILVARRRFVGAFLVIAICLLFSCRPGPLEAIFAQAPFSYLLPDYVLRPVHLFVCLFSALGLTQLSKFVKDESKAQLVYVWLSVLITMLPLVLICTGLSSPIFQNGISQKLILNSFLVISIAAACLLVLGRYRFGKCAAILIPFLNLALIIPSAKSELPYTAFVSLPPTENLELIKTLQSYPEERFSACGDRLIQPNTGLFFGLSDLRTCSPLNHSRYLKFMKALGANLGYCNLMHIPSEISPLADLASLRLIVSNSPIHTADRVNLPQSKESQQFKGGRIMSGMRILGGSCDYVSSAAEIDCHLKLRIHENLYGRYQSAILLVDSSGSELWRSPLQTFGPSKEKGHEAQIDLSIPSPHLSSQTVRVLLLIRDAWTNSEIQADGSSLEVFGGKPVLASFLLKPFDKIESSDGRFGLIYESADLIRVYENKTALPCAYLVHKSIHAESEQDALSQLSLPNFDPRTSVITEGAPVSLNSIGKLDDSVKTLSSVNTELNFETHSSADSVLVNTGLNYPGWNAYVDDKQEALLQSNYLFRGVRVPSGQHRVSFRYEPFSFLFGCLCSLMCFCVGLWVCFFKPKTARKSN